MNKFDEFKKAYEDYPSQDNEGYIPDRAGFKCGFMVAWNLLQIELVKADKIILDIHGQVTIYSKYTADVVYKWKKERGENAIDKLIYFDDNGYEDE